MRAPWGKRIPWSPGSLGEALGKPCGNPWRRPQQSHRDLLERPWASSGEWSWGAEAGKAKIPHPGGTAKITAILRQTKTVSDTFRPTCLRQGTGAGPGCPVFEEGSPFYIYKLPIDRQRGCYMFNLREFALWILPSS